MEKIKMFRSSKKYGFQKGQTFKVGRTINDDLVVFLNGVIEAPVGNLVCSEKKAKTYGILTGKPQLVV